MDPRVGAWEPSQGNGASGSQQSSTQLRTDAQVWQPGSSQNQLPQQQSVDSGGQSVSVRGSAEFYPSGAGSTELHGQWRGSDPATFYQAESASADDAGAKMHGGLLVVDSSTGGGTGDGAELLYGGFQHTEQYSAQTEHYGARSDQPSYGTGTYQSHGFQTHTAHEQHPHHLYGDEATYDYEYGTVAFGHPQSFERTHGSALDPPPDSSPSTISDSLESPALMYSPGGTMYALPGPVSSTSSSPTVRGSAELQLPDVRSRSRNVLLAALSAPAASVSPRLSVEIGAGSAEMPQQPVDYIGVVDFECTCDRIRSQSQGNGQEPEWVHEIIEFPLVLVDTVNLEPVDEFHAYIRPTERPVLTHFCKTLTGISQDTVDAAVTLEVALEQFAAWLAERQLGAPGDPGAVFTIALATDGPWDIVNFLAPECERKGLPFPTCAKHWIDARAAFAEWHQIKQLNVQKMLEWSGMVFEGRPHSGIDDTRNIARIVIHLLSQGCVLHPNCDVTTTHAPLPWLGAGSLRPAAVRGSTEAVIRGSGAAVEYTAGSGSGSSSSSSNGSDGDRHATVDEATSSISDNDVLSPSAKGTKAGSPRSHAKRSVSPEIDEVVEELVHQTLAANDSWVVSPRQAMRSGSAEIDEVVEELVQRTLAATNDAWVVSPRRAKRASVEGSIAEHMMDLVKELVERSLGESGPAQGSPDSTRRPVCARTSLAELDGDAPSTPSGSPTRSSVRTAESNGTRPRDAQADGGGASGTQGGISSPISPQVALARSLSEQERFRRANAEAQAKLAWSEGDAIAHELQELRQEIHSASGSSGHSTRVGSDVMADQRDEADRREDGRPT